MVPHEHIHPHALPVRNVNKARFLATSFACSSLFTLAFMGALLFSGISMSVIIPSSAPIWMGTLTLGYMMQVEK